MICKRTFKGKCGVIAPNSTKILASDQSSLTTGFKGAVTTAFSNDSSIESSSPMPSTASSAFSTLTSAVTTAFSNDSSIQPFSHTQSFFWPYETPHSADNFNMLIFFLILNMIFMLTILSALFILVTLIKIKFKVKLI